MYVSVTGGLYCPQKKQETYDELRYILIYLYPTYCQVLPNSQGMRVSKYVLRFINSLKKKQLSSHQIKGSDTLYVAEFYLKEETGNKVTGGR